MTIELELVNNNGHGHPQGRNHRKVVGYVLNGGGTKVIKKKKQHQKRCSASSRMPSSALIRSRQPAAGPMTLQRLYECCRHVFAAAGTTVPSPDHVLQLRHILDAMVPEDVGLSRELQFFKPSSSAKVVPRVTYTTIYKCRNFSMCIFFLPATAVIPLHNHPGMTVFSKLLLGTMHIKAYDWVDRVDDESLPSSELRLARLKANSVFRAPCDTSVLYPTSGGNIHAFTAIEPCAFLDVIGPPYSKEDGRDCTYYKDTPYSAMMADRGTTITKEEADLYGWLEEIEVPKESKMDGIEYLGPQINEETSS